MQPLTPQSSTRIPFISSDLSPDQYVSPSIVPLFLGCWDLTLERTDTDPQGDTPYEGGYYEVDIVIPDAYPFEPVKMKFIT